MLKLESDMASSIRDFVTVSNFYWSLLSFKIVWLKNFFLIVITFYLPSCLGQETAKEPFGLRVKLSPAHLSIN